MIILLSLFVDLFVSSTIDRKACTVENLLPVDNGDLKLLSNLLSPLAPRIFFTDAFESQPILVRNRSPGFYGGLIDLNVIGDYLKSQDPDALISKDNGLYSGEKIKHGHDWKLVKRVWRNGEWWSSSPNISMIPIEVVFASFQRKGYSIVINKMQNFHPPLKKGD